MKTFLSISLMSLGYLVLSLLIIFGNFYLKPIGAYLLNIAVLFLAVALILFAIISLLYRINKRSTDILSISFSSFIVLTILLFTSLNFILHTKLTAVSADEVTPIRKFDYLSSVTTGKPAALFNYELREGAGIVYRYPKGYQDPQALIDPTVKAMEKRAGDIERYFGDISNEDLVVIFSDFPENNKMFEMGGTYYNDDRSIYLNILPDENYLDLLGGTYIHEYSHYALDMAAVKNGLSIHNFPSWFYEGVAEHLQYANSMFSIQEVSVSEWVPFSEVARLGDWKAHLHDEYNPYFQSRILVDRLVQQEGTDVIMEIITNTKLSSFEDAFYNATGQTSEEFGHETILELKTIEVRLDKSYDMETQEAIVHLQELIEDYPGLYDAYSYLAELYRQSGMYEKEIQTKRQIIQADWGQAYDYFDMAVALLLLDRLDEAIFLSKEAVELDGGMDPYFGEFSEDLIKLESEINRGNPFGGTMEFISTMKYLDANEEDRLIELILDKNRNYGPETFKKELVQRKTDNDHLEQVPAW